MKIKNFSDINKGIYACYVHASSGTIRQLIQIQRNKNKGYEIKFTKASKRIHLDIEEHIHGLSQINKPVLGESYEFDCITGTMQHYDLCNTLKNFSTQKKFSLN